jgi:hypothetical protein
MIEIILPKTKVKVELYESIKEQPMLRKHELGKLIMKDINIGDSMDSVAQHFKNWHDMVHLKKYDESVQEMMNLHNNFFYMLNSVSISSYCFVTYVHSIGGKPYTDLSTSGADRVIKQLSEGGLTVGDVEDQVDEFILILSFQIVIQNFKRSLM